VPDEAISQGGLAHESSEVSVISSALLVAAVALGALGTVAAITGLAAWRVNSAQDSSRSVSIADAPAAAPLELDAAPTGGSFTWRF
jgi:hypothetical protein